MDLTDIIAQLANAVGPSRELDRLIEEAIVPDVRRHPYDDMVKEGYVILGAQAYLPPHYTSSRDASLPGEDIVSVAEQKQLPGKPALWAAVHRPPEKGQHPDAGHGHTEALARRVAALKAMVVT